jgi:hypothetical protein
MKNQFEWLKSNTAPNLHSTSITGILDKKTNKIYHISIFSLLHLGAKCCNILPECQIFQKEKSSINHEDKIMVLGLNVPALFFTSLVQLENNLSNKVDQKEIIQHRIFRYSLVKTYKN